MTETRLDRRLAAVLAADVAGYSRLMGADEEGTLARLKAVRKAVVDPSITGHRGRIVKTTGDGMLVEFVSAVDAVRSAIEVQRGMAEHNVNVPPHKLIQFRIGIHVGDIIIDDDDLFGDGVNIAARFEGIAEPGGACISDDTYRQIRGKIEIVCEDLGPQTLKNIAEPIRAWKVRIAGSAAKTTKTSNFVAQGAPLALPGKPSIAVLPFQNMSGDPEQEYFADGVVEDIITGLSRFKTLFVIARNSSFTYKGQAVDIKQVGRELGVRYVLEGSVRKAATKIRISGQLIDALTGAHIWAEKIDGALDDLFDLQDRITASVVSAVAPTIEQAEIQRIKQQPTSVSDSYDSYLRGVASIYRGEISSARSQFNKAVALDPEYAAAHAMLAYTYSRELANKGIVPTLEMRSAAALAIDAALRTMNDDPFVMARCAHPMAYVCHEFDRAALLCDRAIDLNPNLSVGWLSRGWISIMIGEPERAIESFEKLLRLSPLDPLRPFSLSGIAFAYFYLDRYDEGRNVGKEIMQLLPHHQSFAAYIVNCVGLGEFEEAKRAAGLYLKFDPDFRLSRANAIFVIGPPTLRKKFDDALRTAGIPE